jgi:hypothetical protein
MHTGGWGSAPLDEAMAIVVMGAYFCDSWAGECNDREKWGEICRPRFCSPRSLLIHSGLVWTIFKVNFLTS